MIPNRARHALFAGGAAALAWAAAEELAGHKTVRMTALLGLAAGFAGMATSSIKSQTTETRVNGLADRTAALESGKIGNVEFTNLTFLAGLKPLPSPSSPTTGGSWDPNTGTTWGSGERGYINGLYGSLSTFYGWVRASGLTG